MSFSDDPVTDRMQDRIEEKLRNLMIASSDFDALKVFYRGEPGFVPVKLYPFAVIFLAEELEAIGQEGYEPATGLTARHQIVRGGLETRGRRRHAEQPRDDAPDVDVQRRDRDPEGRRRDRSRRVGPDPGQGSQFGDRLGHATAMVRDDLPCTFAQCEGATVVTEPRPRCQQLVSTGPGEVDRRRPTIDESPPCRPDALDPGLLRHHFGDEHLPRVRGIADQKRPTSRLVPPEQAAVQPAPAHRFHLAEDSLRFAAPPGKVGTWGVASGGVGAVRRGILDQPHGLAGPA